MLHTPFIETLSDLFIRSAQWRGRDELFVDDENRIPGTDALDQALGMAQGFAANGAASGEVIALGSAAGGWVTTCRPCERRDHTACPVVGHNG
jgi:hypothetical protein